MLLIERVLKSVEADPEAPAFISGDQPMSYRAFLALLSSTVRHLRGQGIAAGEPVALTMSQSPLHIITFIALAHLGALVVPASPFLRPGDRAQLLRKFGVRTAISDRAGDEVEGCRLIALSSMGARGDEVLPDAAPFAARADSPLRIALTSGTTGTPKGTLQTHARFVQRLDRMECDVVERPRVVPPDLHITTGLLQALHALCKGGAVVIPRGYDNAQFFDAVRRHRVTHVGLPPANLALMLAALPDQGPAFPSIRHLRIMGATPSAAFLEAARR
jgi:acyl-coenzyme A synthetase/AMP-(fatty) acid ligase